MCVLFFFCHLGFGLGIYGIQVAKELKEEKRLRWEAEDEAERLRKEVSQLKTIVAEKSTQVCAFAELHSAIDTTHTKD